MNFGGSIDKMGARHGLEIVGLGLNGTLTARIGGFGIQTINAIIHRFINYEFV